MFLGSGVFKIAYDCRGWGYLNLGVGMRLGAEKEF